MNEKFTVEVGTKKVTNPENTAWCFLGDVIIYDEKGTVVSHEEHMGQTADEAAHLAFEFAVHNLEFGIKEK